MILREVLLEAAALERFMRATRAVNAAFDATRGEPDFIDGGQSIASSQQRLDAALRELETSERSLDAILARRARSLNHGANHLKLVFLTLVLLLGISSASSVMAAERYTEVWNPPEAQTVKGKSKAHGATQTAPNSKKKRKASTKQIADKAALEPQAAAVPRAKATAPKPSEPVIPRKIEPDGQVMRI
ncbi:hypothetical protein BPMI_02502 [Candidatus Burkholderia pumila]|uniref:Uncharacterized protein n=1 Tax=Candidatus Burkholderia pumila TaxID=1090375 RepID=A0ABR5HMV9_9BURK|nr:hypothetical protein BPMI_02502 [Candidatus Burkholderia pumila]